MHKNSPSNYWTSIKYKKRKRNDIKLEEENSSKKYIINKPQYNIEFIKKNPNFIYHSTIIHINDGNLLNNKFEAFYCYKDKKLYIASPNHFNYQLYILCLNNNRMIVKLKGHSFFITSIRYFFNQTDKKEYLISADRNKWVIIWDINNNFDKKVVINTRIKDTHIYSCLILFNITNTAFLSTSNNSTFENEDNTNSYIIISSNNLSYDNESSEYTSIYLLDNDSFIKSTYNNNTNYLLSWLNKMNNKEYIIELCKEKVLIYNIFDEDTYYEFENGINYMSGFICNKYDEIDYLFTNTIEKYIFIYNLNEKILVNTINIGGWSLYNIIQWDNKYIIVIDSYKKLMKIIDIDQGKAISCLSNVHSVGITSIKKINHPLYGESLLTSGKDNKIKLWILK